MHRVRFFFRKYENKEITKTSEAREKSKEELARGGEPWKGQELKSTAVCRRG